MCSNAESDIAKGTDPGARMRSDEEGSIVPSDPGALHEPHKSLPECRENEMMSRNQLSFTLVDTGGEGRQGIGMKKGGHGLHAEHCKSQ